MDVQGIQSMLFINGKRFYTAKYACLMHSLFPAWSGITLTEVIYRPEFTPQFTLPDPTHIGGFILMEMRLDVSTVPGTGLGLRRCLYNRDNPAISTWVVLTGEIMKSVSSHSWSCERRWCSRIKRRRGKMVRSTRKTQRNFPYEATTPLYSKNILLSHLNSCLDKAHWLP